MATQSAEVDRSTTVPFHLKLFYRNGSHFRVEDFPTHPSEPLPSHLQIYTWPNCTLRELSHLLTTALPSLLPSPSVGTRLIFRLIFPSPSTLRGPSSSSVSGQWTSKELGSVVIGGDGTGRLPDENEEKIIGTTGPMAGKLEGEPDKTLQDARFVIGDYLSCAILPPGRDGEVQSVAAVGGMGIGGGRMRAFPEERKDGYGGRRGGYRGGSGGGTGIFGKGGDVPLGEWRRGERLPDSGPRHGRRGGRY